MKRLGFLTVIVRFQLAVIVLTLEMEALVKERRDDSNVNTGRVGCRRITAKVAQGTIDINNIKKKMKRSILRQSIAPARTE
ncbi:hypothetical protein SLA2020_198660 [Shorea laevis]